MQEIPEPSHREVVCSVLIEIVPQTSFPPGFGQIAPDFRGDPEQLYFQPRALSQLGAKSFQYTLGAR